MSFSFGKNASNTCSSVPAQGSLFGSSNAKISLFGDAKIEENQTTKGKEDENIAKAECEPASKNICSECDRYSNKKTKDTRNEHFSELLQSELQYIQPCMRTMVYAKILNYLHSTKRSHFNNESSVLEVEGNVEKFVEET